MKDQSGNWLRSTEKMWISDDIREQYYSPSAFQAALDSYQLDDNANALNNPYFLNQADSTRVYDGSIVAFTVDNEGTTVTFLAGQIVIDGAVHHQFITSDGTLDGYLIGTDGNPLALTANDIADTATGLDGFAAPLASTGYSMAVEYVDGMLTQAGF